MAIVLQTLSNDQEVGYQREREAPFSFSRVFFIDPQSIMSASTGLRVLQDRKVIHPHALQLYEHLSHVVELLRRSSSFQRRMGKNQIVAIEPLAYALAAYPAEAISIDTIQGTGGPLPSLLTLSLNTQAGRVTNIPELMIDFFPQPRLLETAPWEGVTVQLRPPQIGERLGPRFIQKTDLPAGLGRVINETGDPARIFLALQYGPGSGFAISRDALTAVDALCNKS